MYSAIIARSRNTSGELYIGLPGGRTMEQVIAGILMLPPAVLLRLTFILLDERLSGEKNLDTLLQYGLQSLVEMNLLTPSRIIVPAPDTILPERLDLVFIGIGEDGHFASLFPGSYPYYATPQTPHIVHIQNSPKPPAERYTLSYTAFSTLAKEAAILLFFLGTGKKAAYTGFLENSPIDTSPCSFFNNTFGELTIVSDLTYEHGSTI